MNRTFSALWIGAFASEGLVGGRPGKVTGVTSKGIFSLVEKRSIFITPISEKSPHNLNLSSLFPFGEIAISDPVSYSDQKLSFPQQSLFIDVKDTAVWTPASPPPMNISKTEQTLRINRLLTDLNGSTTDEKGLLAGLLAFGDNVTRKTTVFTKEIGKNDLKACLQAGSELIGLGEGLTPAMDDWLAGFLLARVRSGQAAGVEQQFSSELGPALTQLAYQRTTFLSANRIEAACRGWSEGIFLELLDHLLDVDISLPDNAKDRLLGFGHSSGIATVQGIVAACSI